MFIFETSDVCSKNQVGLCTLQKSTYTGKKVMYDIDDFLFYQNINTKNFNKTRKEESQEGQQSNNKNISSSYKLFDDNFKPVIKKSRKNEKYGKISMYRKY